MDSTTPNPCVLKVLSGPQKGAEVLLRPGTYTVGSSEDCDLILNDSLFQSQHFNLTFTPPTVSLEVLQGATFLNGKRLEEGSVEVPFFQFITVGTTQIIIGPDGGGWPLLTAEDAPALDLSTPKSKVVSQEPEGAPKESLPMETSTEANLETLAEAMALASGKPVSSAESLSQALPTAPIPSWRVLLENRMVQGAVAAILLGVASYAFYPQAQKPTVETTPIVLTTQERMKRLEEILQLHHVQNDIKISESQGQLSVDGYLKKEADRQNLHRAIVRVDGRVIFNIQSEENLVTTAQKVLSDMSVSVKIEPSSVLGGIRSTGYVLQSSAWLKAKNFLTADLDHLKELDDKVVTGDSVVTFIKPLLKENGLSAALQVTPEDDEIKVIGTLTQYQGTLWDGISAKLQHYVADQVPISDSVIRSEPEAITTRYFDTSIQSLTTGPFGYVSLKSGEKYFTGAVLPSGYIIVSVESDGITLRKGDAEVVFQPHQS